MPLLFLAVAASLFLYFVSPRSSELLPSEGTPDDILVSDIVARNLATGSLDCPRSVDMLTYETCLLYSGALGMWQRLGFPDDCPDGLSLDRLDNTITIQRRALKPEDPLKAKKSACFAYLFAIQVANALPILVSTSYRIFKLASHQEYSEPGSDPELCLAGRFGSCGNHTSVALAMFELGGYSARSVQFFYEDNGIRLTHVVPEVFIDGAWRLVDPTYGAYWIYRESDKPFSIVKTNDLLAFGNNNRTFLLHSNSALIVHPIYRFISNTKAFGHLNPNASILRGGTGEVLISLIGKSGVENLNGKPNYLGDNRRDGDSLGVEYAIESTHEIFELNIQIEAAAFPSEGPEPELCVDSECQLYSRGVQSYSFFVRNPKKIYIKTNHEVAYLVVSAIKWR